LQVVKCNHIVFLCILRDLNLISSNIKVNCDKHKAMKRIVILGAGITALSTAYKLAQTNNYDITLLEKDDVVGGLAKSIKFNDVISDLGPHRIFSHYPEVLNFIKQIAREDFIYVSRKSKIFIKNRFVEYPIKSGEILKTFGFSASIQSFFSFITQKIKKLFSSPELNSYSEYIKNYFGKYLYGLLFHQYAKKVWGIEPEQISADVARTRVSAGGLGTVIRQKILGESSTNLTTVKNLGYIKGGIGKLSQKMADELAKQGVKIVLSANFQDINFENDKITLNFKHNEILETLHSEFCVSTIPITNLVDKILNKKYDTKISELINIFQYINTVFVFLIVKRSRISENSWLYFPEADIIFNRGYESKNFDSSLAPKDESVICLEVTYLKGDTIDKQSDNAIIEKVKEDFLKTKLVQKEEILSAHSLRVENIYPLYEINYFSKLKSVLGYLSQFENLYSAGRQGLFNHNNIDHCIYMGFKLADAIIKDAKPAQWYANIDEFRNFKIID